MTTGVLIPPDRGSDNVVDDALNKARAAVDAGVRQLWLGQQFDYDAITLAAILGTELPGVGVGTSVVPVNPRHPLVVASAAQTAQAATHGNFSLGLGLGVAFAEQSAYGLSTPRPVHRLREFLTVLRAVRDQRTVDFHGSELTAVDLQVMPVALTGATPFPIYVAAMGPRMLGVTGELADGALPAGTGPRTIETVVVPSLARAAAEAGRPQPRVIPVVSVAVTDDPDAVRAAAAPAMAVYDSIPSYQKQYAHEGVSSGIELAVIGSADAVTKALRRYLDAGATDLVLLPLEPDSAGLARVYDVAAALETD
ncbi:TIGR03564 family F420-dependent LLM class oxidoreductase [Mycolicibacterium moriokaense]|nr:TIGR03564 family F420-dependent LLM class oxidoreductase [Mycolicibacterium moriokaense]